MEELLAGSVFLLYLFAIITVINYQEMGNKQKISIIYIFTYGVEISDTRIGQRLLLIAFIVSLFLYEEYWTYDKAKWKIIRKLRYKFADFFMNIVFRYKVIVFGFAIFLVSDYIKNKVPDISSRINIEDNSVIFILKIISFLMVFCSIHLMLTDPVELNSYEEILYKINKNPYYIMDETECNSEHIDDFYERILMLTRVEDRLYFEREGYTFISLGYVKRYIEEKMNDRFQVYYDWKIGIRKLIHAKSHNERVRLIKKIYRILSLKIKAFCSVIKRGFKSVTVRGNSTIEMQLFRTLIYKRGIVMGKPRKISSKYRVIKRKIFELIFTHIFFKGLKEYLLNSGTPNISKYREYILYLYVHNVISWYDGKRYYPMAKLFCDGGDENKILPVYGWDKEKFFIEILGLSKSKDIDIRIWLYEDVAKEYDLDWEKVVRLANRS